MNLFRTKKDFNIYKNYLCKTELKNKYIELNYEGWKMLLDEAISEIVEKELDMKYLGNGTWATDYNNYCRKVLQLFLINKKYATFKWGWCFDFIPKKKGKKLIYIKSDNQIDSHIFEVSSDFYKNTVNRRKTIISNYREKLNSFEETILIMKENYKEVIIFLLPIIKKYYENTNNYQGIINDIQNKLNNNYYCAINPEMKIVKVYINAFLGKKDEAIKELKNINFENEIIKEEYFTKLADL